jgi:hypothetical protein
MAQLFDIPLILPDGKQVNVLRPYYIAFLPRQNWALVYWDRQGEIFVRRKAFPGKWIEANEYRIFRPFDQTATGLLVRSEAVPWDRFSREIERFRKWSPDDWNEGNLKNWAESLRPEKKAAR